MTALQADAGFKAFGALPEFEYTAAGNCSWGCGAVGRDVALRTKVVVDGVASGESPIDEIYAAILKDIVAVVVMSRDDGLHVSHLPELGKKA